MPRRPQRPCSYPGCPNLCDGQYCEEHSKLMNRRYNKFVRSADSNKKYGREWRQIRKRYAAAHPLCEMCLKVGAVKISTGPIADSGPGLRAQKLRFKRGIKPNHFKDGKHRPFLLSDGGDKRGERRHKQRRQTGSCRR